MTISSIFLNDTIFGLDLFDLNDFIKLIIRFSFNLFIIIVIARLIYYRSTYRKDYLFSYLIVGSVVFLICFLLDNVKLELGLALGLFAIFGIIRYRTAQIPIKEMTYLFMIIGISVINALANKKISYTEIIATNAFIILLTIILEKTSKSRNLIRKTVIYEKIELIKPEKYNELLSDLENRTGLKIYHIEIGRIDFMRDIARIRIFFYEDENGIDSENKSSAKFLLKK